MWSIDRSGSMNLKNWPTLEKWEDGLGSHTKPKVSARDCMHKQILHAESRPCIIIFFFVQSKLKVLSYPFLRWYGSNDSAEHIGQVEKYGIWRIDQLWRNVRRSSTKPTLSARHFVDINRFCMKKAVPVASASSLVQFKFQVLFNPFLWSCGSIDR